MPRPKDQLYHRDAQNSRRTFVKLTPQGEEVLGHLIGYPVSTDMHAERLAALSDEELTACIQEMSILSRALTGEPTLLSFTLHLGGTGQTLEERRASFSRVRKDYVYDDPQPSYEQNGSP